MILHKCQKKCCENDNEDDIAPHRVEEKGTGNFVHNFNKFKHKCT